MIRFDGGNENKPKISLDEPRREGANIKVVGVGGGGGNAINRMMSAGVAGVDFIAANTDAQDLKKSLAGFKIQLGEKLTKGLGAGSNPEVGRKAAEESHDKLFSCLEGADMVFITCGLGGGTGTGAAPYIASLASELGALVVAVVTKPFEFEGLPKMKKAEQGLEELWSGVDTTIVIPNEKLQEHITEDTTLDGAFLMVDDVLRQAVQGISDLITKRGYINLDFADIRTTMNGMGRAVMGVGYAQGPNCAVAAAEKAIANPLLEDSSIEGARSVLFNISGGPDLKFKDMQAAAAKIKETLHPDAGVIFGHVKDPELNEGCHITLIATGFEQAAVSQAKTAAVGANRELSASDLTTPTHLGGYRLKTADAATLAPKKHASGLNTEDLDTPTFLRRTFKKIKTPYDS